MVIVKQRENLRNLVEEKKHTLRPPLIKLKFLIQELVDWFHCKLCHLVDGWISYKKSHYVKKKWLIFIFHLVETNTAFQ